MGLSLTTALIIGSMAAAAGGSVYASEQQRKAARKARKQIQIPEPGVEKEVLDTKLAQQRRSLEALRKGRRSLRIDIPRTRNPGVAGGGSSGIRIPS